MSNLAAGIIAITGSTLVALAGLGVVRFPDLLARMHAATKAPTLGFLLVATAAALTVEDSGGKLLLAVALILVTAPVAAHLVARAAHGDASRRIRFDVDDELGAAIDRSRTP
jgi:multicomponent Na+:H+ antiporter subunit G